MCRTSKFHVWTDCLNCPMDMFSNQKKNFIWHNVLYSWTCFRSHHLLQYPHPPHVCNRVTSPLSHHRYAYYAQFVLANNCLMIWLEMENAIHRCSVAPGGWVIITIQTHHLSAAGVSASTCTTIKPWGFDLYTLEDTESLLERRQHLGSDLIRLKHRWSVCYLYYADCI